MSVHYLPGSAQLIELLNGLGHCTSNSAVLKRNTALAELQLKRGEEYVPLNVISQVLTTLVRDNNDFGEETLSRRGTTHNTNGIIIQHGNQLVTEEQEQSSLARSRKKSLSHQHQILNCTLD